MKQEAISNEFTQVQISKFKNTRPEDDFYVRKVKYTVHETSYQEHLCNLCAFNEMGENCPRDDGFEKWFECKLNFITLNEMGDEKKTPVLILIQSDTTSNANADLITHMKSSMADYTIEAVKETKIIEYFKYEA